MAATHPRPADSGRATHNVTRVVKILMALEGMDQRDLARSLGVATSAVSRSFSGERKWQLDDIERLAEIFDRPQSYFLEPAESIVRASHRDGDPGPSGGIPILQDRRSRNRPAEQAAIVSRCIGQLALVAA